MNWAMDKKLFQMCIRDSSYTETLPILPGEDCGLGPNERRQEITWTLKTRKDAVNGCLLYTSRCV